MEFLTKSFFTLASVAGSGALLLAAVGSAVQAETSKLVNAPQSASADAEVIAQIPPVDARLNQVDEMMLPADGTVKVMVYNDTGDDVIYRVVGNTDFRYLPAGESTELLGLPLPVNFFFDRADNGLVKANVEVDNEAEAVEITIEPTAISNNDLDTMLINESGEIYLL